MQFNVHPNPFFSHPQNSYEKVFVKLTCWVFQIFVQLENMKIHAKVHAFVSGEKHALVTVHTTLTI